MATPHLDAREGDYAPVVLMPGDPLRARFIAGNYFQNNCTVNDTRGMYGYTGTYHGVPLSVQGSGMGCPSMGIYAYELFHIYGVRCILRIGTAGAIAPFVKLRDVILGQGACTNSHFAAQYELPGTFAPIASFRLLSAAAQRAEILHLPVHIGNLLTSDRFYDDSNSLSSWVKMGVLGVEMETAALYLTAAREGREALSICTVSDCPLTGEATSAEEREKHFLSMVELALETARDIS